MSNKWAPISYIAPGKKKKNVGSDTVGEYEVDVIPPHLNKGHNYVTEKVNCGVYI